MYSDHWLRTSDGDFWRKGYALSHWSRSELQSDASSGGINYFFNEFKNMMIAWISTLYGTTQGIKIATGLTHSNASG